MRGSSNAGVNVNSPEQTVRGIFLDIADTTLATSLKDLLQSSHVRARYPVILFDLAWARVTSPGLGWSHEILHGLVRYDITSREFE